MDSGCGGESLWVTAEQQLDRIPWGAFIDDREKLRKGEGDDNMLHKDPSNGGHFIQTL